MKIYYLWNYYFINNEKQWLSTEFPVISLSSVLKDNHYFQFMECHYHECVYIITIYALLKKM